MDMSDRDRINAERREQRYRAPFDPGTTPECPLTPDHRAANALEYIAFQLGVIAQAAERIAEQYPKKKG